MSFVLEKNDMAEEKKTRNYPSQSALNPGIRLEALRSPALAKARPGYFAQLSHQQRVTLVEKLIDFLKGI